MNKIILTGHLGRDPEMNYTPAGVAVTRFSLAVNRITKSQSGERQEETDWFNVTAFRQLAETCNTYLHKGSKVLIEGKLQPRKYTDRDGMQRTSLDVIANEMEMLTPKSAQGGSSDQFLAGGADDTDPLGDIDDHPF
jgi:single-strand DNA-binding protein